VSELLSFVTSSSPEGEGNKKIVLYIRNDSNYVQIREEQTKKNMRQVTKRVGVLFVHHQRTTDNGHMVMGMDGDR